MAIIQSHRQCLSPKAGKNHTPPGSSENFSLPKEMGPQRTDFGGRYVFFFWILKGFWNNHQRGKVCLRFSKIGSYCCMHGTTEDSFEIVVVQGNDLERQRTILKMKLTLKMAIILVFRINWQGGTAKGVPQKKNAFTRVKRKGAFGASAQGFSIFDCRTRHSDTYQNQFGDISDTYQCAPALCLERFPTGTRLRGYGHSRFCRVNGPHISRYCDTIAPKPHIAGDLLIEVSTSPKGCDAPLAHLHSQRYLCDTPCGNISWDSCAIPDKDKHKKAKRYYRYQQCEIYASTAAGPPGFVRGLLGTDSPDPTGSTWAASIQHRFNIDSTSK